MAVAANALCTLANTLSFMGLDADDLPASGIALYHDGTGAVTAATVTVTDLTMTLVATGAATITTTYTFSLAAFDTLGEIVTDINALAGTESAGWTARLLGPSAQASGDLIPQASTSAWGQDLEQVLNYQDVTLIESLIDAVSDAVEKYCGRNFVSADYREWHDGMGEQTLALRHFPVTAIKRLATGSATALTVRGTTTTDLRATVEVQDTQLVLSRFDSNGTEMVSNVTFASNPTASALVTAINLLSGWSATNGTNCISLDLHRLGGRDALNKSVEVTFPDDSDLEYRVDEDAGTVELVRSEWFDRGGEWGTSGIAPHGSRNVLVHYTGGYATVPDDLEQIALELVSEAYNARGKDSTLQSEGLGAYNYANRVLSQGSNEGSAFRERLAMWRVVR